MYDNTLLASPPPPLPPETPIAQKESRLGIAAFVLGVAALLFFCAGFLISFGYGFSLAAQNPYADPSSLLDQSSPLVILASGLICCSPVLSLLGVGLGVAAVVQKTDKKTLGIIGLVINGLIVLSVYCLFVLGLIGQAGILVY